MIKQFFSLLVAMVMLVAIAVSPTYANDIKGHQMESELTYWSKLGVITSDAKGNYNPNRAVTRGEFAAYIARALKLPESTKHTFKDLKSTNELTPLIQAAADSNILGGYPDGTFRPNDKITRQHMAALLQKALRYQNVPLNEASLSFKDNAKISSQFKSSVATSVYYNIIRGAQTNKGVYFTPQGNATIAHAAAFLYRMKTVVDKHGVKVEEETPEPETPVTPEPTPEPEPETPKEPEYNANAFYIGSVVNGVVKTQTTPYLTYEEAQSAYAASKSATVIVKTNKVIHMKSGVASAANNIAKTVETTTIYATKDFKSSLTYIVEGSEMKYLEGTDQYVKVQIADTVGYAKPTAVTLKPVDLVKGQGYYYSSGGYLTHKSYNHATESYYGAYVIDVAPSFMKDGVSYYSQDGVNFYSDAQLTKKVGTSYPYFQFATVRHHSNYTAEELDALIMTLLKEVQATGQKKFANATTQSRLIGMGPLLKQVEASHNVNALFILAAAIHESEYGISDNSIKKNNIFGIAVFDSTPEKGETYVSRDDSVLAFLNKYVNYNYIPHSGTGVKGSYTKGASPGNKTAGMNVHYASDPFWGSKIAGHMFRIDNRFGKKDYNQLNRAMVTYGGSTVNAREAASTSSPIVFTFKAKDVGTTGMFGYPVAIIEETVGTDGYIWYKLLSDNNPPARYVWVRSDLVKKIGLGN